MNKKISIILPVYNSDKFLKQSIDSVLVQNESDFELIIIDNGSSDNSKNIIKSYNDSRIVFIDLTKTDGDNSARTINKGLMLSKGKYITWISSDDYYPNADSLKILSTVLDNESDVDMVSGRYVLVGNLTGIVGNVSGIIDFNMMKGSNYIGGSFLFRRKCFETVGLMREDLIGVDDWNYWIRISKNYKIKKIIDATYCWRKHDNNLSSMPSRINEINDNILKVKQEVF